MFSIHIDSAISWRGGQNQVLVTARGLSARGHRVAIVAHADGELRRRSEAAGLETIPLTLRGEMDLSAAWQLSRALRQARPDVVHAHDPHALAAAALALSIGAPQPRPALVAARRVDFHIKGNAFSRWKYRQVDRFLAASDAIRRMLVQDRIEPARVVTVHEGIEIERVTSIEPASLHTAFWLPTHVPIVGNIAALVPHKGQKHLVEAAPIVIRRVPEAHFVIFGEGELRETLERQVKDLHLEKRVLLPGFRPDVLAFLKAFDVFVMSSVTEGLGTSLLDAMAAARPVVATAAGGMPEVVEHGTTGLVVPPRDGEALAGAIIRLLESPEERARMGAAGFERVRSRFSAERMVGETLRVYEDVVGRKAEADNAPRGTPA